MAALLLGPRDRLLEIVGHAAHLVDQLLVGREPSHSCDRSDLPRCTASRELAVADRGQQLLAELLVLGERDRKVFPARGLRLQVSRSASFEHAESSPFGFAVLGRTRDLVWRDIAPARAR